MLLRSLVYGYTASAASGLAVAVVGISAGLSQETIIGVASPAGMVFGLLGLAYAWRGQVAALARVAAGRRR